MHLMNVFNYIFIFILKKKESMFKQFADRFEEEHQIDSL